jgi:hypothetical protein
MVVRFKQIARRLNLLKRTKRYAEKRKRRAFLTEAYLDGELALYKPAYSPYKVYTNKVKWVKPEPADVLNENKDWDEAVKILNEEPAKLTWFDKFILWIRKICPR